MGTADKVKGAEDRVNERDEDRGEGEPQDGMDSHDAERAGQEPGNAIPGNSKNWRWWSRGETRTVRGRHRVRGDS